MSVVFDLNLDFIHHIRLNQAFKETASQNYLQSKWVDFERLKLIFVFLLVQMQTEVDSWPYNFPLSDDYPTAEQRGSVTGRLLVRDRYCWSLCIFVQYYLFFYG